MSDIFRYRAFISYRHVERDRKWARWLVERLESFRTPGALVRRGAPRRIGQLFRDDDEVPSSSDLSHRVEDALRASEFLIVVCSPEAASSEWIRREIEFFRALGRGDKILTLLVAGEPEQSFPANLRRDSDVQVVVDEGPVAEIVYTGPIAADVRPRKDERHRRTRRRALIRLAAGLLGVGFDDVVQRERQRRVQRRIGWSAVFTAILLALAFGYATTEFAAEERMEEGWVVHTYQVMDALRIIDAGMNQAEASVRGYDLTRKPRYLLRYRLIGLRISEDINRFQALSRDNPEQQSRARALRKLMDGQMAALRGELTISSLDKSAREKFQDLMDREETMKDARLMSVAMGLTEEQRLLSERIEARRAGERGEVFSALVTALAALLILFGTALASALRSDWI